jgi:hypothetical protein
MVQGNQRELCYSYSFSLLPTPKTMKKVMLLIVLTAMALTSCSSYTCATYAKTNTHKKVNVNYQ